MMTDPIADLLTRVRNGIKAGHDKVEIPASKMKANICKVLKDEGYIKSFKIVAADATNINLKVYFKPNAIMGIKRISKPGLRIYKAHDKLPRVLSGLGISVLSTSKGVISSRKAKELKVGGEVLCNVW
ncbi:MAG: 30S ribosomal protein S8 [Bacteriovoracaceae bacterium]